MYFKSLSRLIAIKPITMATASLIVSIIIFNPVSANNSPTIKDKVNPNSLPSLVELTSYKVEWGGRPRDPYVAPNGMVWFCGQADNYIARLNPKSGEMKQFKVPEGSHPHNLIVDKAGFVWYAGNRNAHIGKLNPKNGNIKQYAMPKAIKDPHTLIFDENENIWFTAQHSNIIGHLDTDSGDVRYVSMTESGSRPYGIKLDSNGTPWSVLVGTNKLAAVDPESIKLTEIEIPREEARPRRLEITSNNNIWYVDYAKGYLGRYSPNEKSFKEWLSPAGHKSQPYATALDHNDVLWFAETGPYPNNLIGFDTNKEAFISHTVVKEGGDIRHTYFDPSTNKIWFGVDIGYIVSAQPQEKSSE